MWLPANFISASRCLRSLLADAKPNEFEIIVVCNGCKDDTAERAREFEAQGVKVLEIETEQMRRVARKEKESIRDEVLQELLPRAFTRSKLTYAYIDPRQGWILVDNPTASKAEEMISHKAPGISPTFSAKTIRTSMR